MAGYDMQAFIRDLEDLRRLPLITKAELKAYEKASIELILKARSGDLESDVPHFVWHYVADGDIRFKDPRYATVQERELDEALKALRASVSR